MSAFIEGRRGDFGVEPICRALGVSASAYYERRSGRRSGRAAEDERLLELIRAEHRENYEAYGYRRMWKHLRRLGESTPRCRVQRLMRAHGIQGVKRRGRPWRTTRPDADARPLPDLLQRDFTAERPDARWVADFTYVRCFEGVVFFAFILEGVVGVGGGRLCGVREGADALVGVRVARVFGQRRAAGSCAVMLGWGDAGRDC